MDNSLKFKTYTEILLSRLEECPERIYLHLLNDKT